ncbi:MAG: hypothetical protein KGZ59_03940 [Chitinophagaceae bacterium]|nr:hypothetical protein [Chitinophagaceae bacterium]
MECRVNILEPWESGTNKSIKGEILQNTGNQFLLSVVEKINVKGNLAQFFVCKVKNEVLRTQFNNCTNGIYEISMVYDKNINNALQLVPDINDYRGNFLTGEIII